MIPFHIFKLEMLFADRADAFLSLVCFSFLVIAESSDIQISFFSIQNIRIDNLALRGIFAGLDPGADHLGHLVWKGDAELLC